MLGPGKALVEPKVVALVGVSDNPKKLSARPFQFCQQHGFSGKIYIVNPRRKTVIGEPAYPTVMAIPDKVDHAYILLGNSMVEAALDDCILAGVKVVTILADGFAEAGKLGFEKQKRLVKKANKAGIMMIGPNSMGVVNTRKSFVCTTNAAFKTQNLIKGRFAVLSHSGSLIGTLVSRGEVRNIGFSKLVSLGNEAQSCIGTVGLSLIDDTEIDGFILFLETLRNPKRFSKFASEANKRNKPVVAYMLGKSEEGQELSVSHTGALTGDSRAVKAYLKQNYVDEVMSLDALFEAPQLLLQRERMKGRPKHVIVVTTTGGGGAMLVDQLSVRGVLIGELNKSVREYFQKKEIPCGTGKLVDVTLAGAQYHIMKEVISKLMNEPSTGALAIVIGSSAQFNPDLAVKPIIDAVKENVGGAPLIAFPLPSAPKSIAMLKSAGVPVFGGLESCAESIALFLSSSGSCDKISANDDLCVGAVEDAIKNWDLSTRGEVLDEVSSTKIFETLGLRCPKQIFIPDFDEGNVLGLEEIIATAQLSYPLVVKVVSTALPHKSDFGGVVLDVKNFSEFKIAVSRLYSSICKAVPKKRIEGILIQEMQFGLGEAIVGIRLDNLVGPVVAVGAGGLLAEIYKDVSIRPAPVSTDIARNMIAEVRGFEIFRGYRGRPAGDLNALAELISKISKLSRVSGIAEAEVNPVMVKSDGVVLLDGLIRINSGKSLLNKPR